MIKKISRNIKDTYT